MNKLEISYKDKATIDRGNYFLFEKNIAIQFLMDCEEENIRVLGIDGFYKINESTIQPSMENSIDFSSSSYKGSKSNIYEDGRKFIQSREDNIYFEIVCDD